MKSFALHHLYNGHGLLHNAKNGMQHCVSTDCDKTEKNKFAIELDYQLNKQVQRKPKNITIPNRTHHRRNKEG